MLIRISIVSFHIGAAMPWLFDGAFLLVIGASAGHNKMTVGIKITTHYEGSIPYSRVDPHQTRRF